MEAAIREAITPARQSSKWRVTALAAIVVAAAALRSINLGTKSIWLDEAYRIYLARMGWHDFLQAVKHPFGANSVAYHLVLRYWLLLSSSEAAIRSLSVIFGLGLVLAIYKLGAELFDWQTGVIAAALAASNALLIRYSQEICAYTPAALLAVISSLYLWRAVKGERGGDWVGYVIAATAMLYCHVLSVFVVVAQAGAALFTYRTKLKARAIISFACVAVAFIPLGWCIAFAPPRPRVWTLPPGIRELRGLVFDLGGPDGMLLGSLFLLLLVFSLRNKGDGKLTVRDRSWRYNQLLMWALGPPVLLFLLSQWKPLFIARYLLPSVPAVLLLAAAGLRSLNRKWLAVFCVSAVLLLSVYNSALYLHHRSDYQDSDDWRHAAAYVVRQARRGDAVVLFAHHERFPFQYYRARLAAEGWEGQIFPRGSDESLLEESIPIENLSFPSTTAASYTRVWLVYEGVWALPAYNPEAHLRDFRKGLAAVFETSSEQHFGNIEVILYSGNGFVSTTAATPDETPARLQ